MDRRIGVVVLFVLACFVFMILVGCATRTVIVKREPPPLRMERPGPKPFPKAVWIEGHWQWNASSGDYVWISGHWVKPRPGKVWVKGHWKKVPGGWVWVKGYWR